VVVRASSQKCRYRPALRMAAKKHHTEGKVSAEARTAAAAHEMVSATPKSASVLRLETRKGIDTAIR
jgi:hypothetical protein